MGQGGYIFCEWDSVKKNNPLFQAAFIKLENEMIAKCNAEWAPKTFGALTPKSSEYGRTTILPQLFDTGNATLHAGAQFGAVGVRHGWRQTFITVGHQELITGSGFGDTLPEDFKVAWIGLALPNKNQYLTEIRMQIGDRKYGRINLEEMRIYNKPAIIFEEGLILDEEESFHLYGYIEPGIGSNLPQNGPGGVSGRIYNRVVMLGAAYYKVKSKVLGNCGAVI